MLQSMGLQTNTPERLDSSALPPAITLLGSYGVGPRQTGFSPSAIRSQGSFLSLCSFTAHFFLAPSSRCLKAPRSTRSPPEGPLVAPEPLWRRQVERLRSSVRRFLWTTKCSAS